MANFGEIEGEFCAMILCSSSFKGTVWGRGEIWETVLVLHAQIRSYGGESWGPPGHQPKKASGTRVWYRDIILI